MELPEANMFDFLRCNSNTYVVRLFYLLSSNQHFRDAFAARSEELEKTCFAPERMIAVIDSVAGLIAPDMPRQCARWNHPLSVPHWHATLDSLRRFARVRTAIVAQQLQVELHHAEQVQAPVSDGRKQRRKRPLGIRPE